MTIHARKYDPPKKTINEGEISIDALIKPSGKYISISKWSLSEEGVLTSMSVDIPIKIIEREMRKF